MLVSQRDGDAQRGRKGVGSGEGQQFLQDSDVE